MKKEKRLIDANRLKEAVTTDYYEHFTRYHDTDQIALIDMVCEDIDESPTVEVSEVIHGEWNCCNSEWEDIIIGECSICGIKVTADDYTTIDQNYKYCPNCGAKMGK